MEEVSDVSGHFVRLSVDEPVRGFWKAFDGQLGNELLKTIEILRQQCGILFAPDDESGDVDHE